jgi:hypothetical protein
MWKGEAMATDAATRVGPYLQRLIDNDYAQDNLRQAAASIQAAYERASKRRVKVSRDEKLRRQVRDATRSVSEAAAALRANRKKPKRRWGRRLLVLLGLGALGAAAALAASEDLRRKVSGEESAQPETEVGPAPAEPVSA